ncbi:SpoIIE family protein phosphatase, partial [Solemya velum gill symbiont]
YLDAEAGSVFLLVDNDEILECRASEGPVDITGLRLPAGQGIVGQTVQENDTLIIRDVSKSKSFNVAVDEDTGFQTRSILCAPLTVRGERLGALELINKQGSDGLFSDRDRSFLSALASSAALAMLNARMAADLVEQEKVRKELEMAREIQNSLLPPMPPQDAPIHGLNIPARGVSGDLYLFFPLSNGRLFFALGDVSGKGIHAALFMAKTVSLIRALAKLEHSPGKLFARLNDEIRETASRGMFITLAAGTFDPASGKVCMTNAGHEPPLFRNIDGEYVAYPADAPPLGILPDLVFEEVEIMLEGGAFYLFTDGMTEGFDSEGQALGVAGVKAAIEQHQNLNPQARIQAMVEPLTDTDTQLRDDITLLVVEHQPIQVLAKIEVSALPTNLKGLRDGLREVLVENEIDKALVEKLVLAVGEAVMNVVQHGFDGGGAEGR